MYAGVHNDHNRIDLRFQESSCGTIWLSVVVDDEQDDSWNLPGSDYCCGQLVNAWRILDGEVERVDDRLR